MPIADLEVKFGLMLASMLTITHSIDGSEQIYRVPLSHERITGTFVVTP